MPFAVDEFGHIGAEGIRLLTELAARRESGARVVFTEAGCSAVRSSASEADRAARVAVRVQRWQAWVGTAVHTAAAQVIQAMASAEH